MLLAWFLKARAVLSMVEHFTRGVEVAGNSEFAGFQRALNGLGIHGLEASWS